MISKILKDFVEGLLVLVNEEDFVKVHICLKHFIYAYGINNVLSTYEIKLTLEHFLVFYVCDFNLVTGDNYEKALREFLINNDIEKERAFEIADFYVNSDSFSGFITDINLLVRGLTRGSIYFDSWCTADIEKEDFSFFLIAEKIIEKENNERESSFTK